MKRRMNFPCADHCQDGAFLGPPASQRQWSAQNHVLLPTCIWVKKKKKEKDLPFSKQGNLISMFGSRRIWPWEITRAIILLESWSLCFPATDENTAVLPVLKCWWGCLTNVMEIQYKYEVLFACLVLEPWAMFSGFSLQLWEQENYFILKKK